MLRPYSATKIKVITHIVMVLSLLLSSIGMIYAVPPTAPQVPTEGLTPVQRDLVREINARAAQGLPTPSVQYVSENELLPGASAESYMAMPPIEIFYSGPQDAGLAEWGPMLIPVSNADGSIVYQDFSEEWAALIAEKAPGLEVGFEPRTLKITETVIYPDATATAPLAPLPVLPSASTRATSENILMGFTYGSENPPVTQYLVNFELTIPGTLIGMSMEIGYKLSWAYGLRLPAQVKLVAPMRTAEWQPISMTASLQGLDWTEQQYIDAGLVGEKGKEFLMHFSALFFIDFSWPFGSTEVTASFERDEGKSFKTPFGKNASFPLPGIKNIHLIDVPVMTVGIFGTVYVSFGVGLEFRLSSVNTTASWNVVSDSNASGGGTISFTAPGKAVKLEPIQVYDGPPYDVAVELTDFKYHFDYFAIDVFVNVGVSLNLLGRPIPLAEDRFPLFSWDLSSVVGGAGLYVGDHVVCNWVFDCPQAGPDNVVQAMIPIDNTAVLPMRNYFTSTAVQLSWNQISWANAYELQVANNSAFRNASTYNAGNTLEFMPPLTGPGVYFYRVRAQRANLTWGPWSVSDSFVVDSD